QGRRQRGRGEDRGRRLPDGPFLGGLSDGPGRALSHAFHAPVAVGGDGLADPRIPVGAPMSRKPSAAKPGEPPFWKRKRLSEMTRREWESLCGGCARWCLIKLEDCDTGSIDYTDIACRLLDLDRCRCTD